MTHLIAHILRTLERVTRPPRMGHDVDVVDSPDLEYQHHYGRMEPGTRYYHSDGYREPTAEGMWEWHDLDGADQLAEREAEEEVAEPDPDAEFGRAVIGMYRKMSPAPSAAADIAAAIDWATETFPQFRGQK